MPQLTLRISEETLKKLQEYAYKRNLTVTDYVLSRAIPNYLDEVLTVDKVLDKLTFKKSGDVFSLKDLFSKQEWESFSSGSRISTGRLFFQAYKKSDFNLKNIIEFIGKNSANLANYKTLI